MVEYDSELAYLESKTGAKEKIIAIDLLIDQLLLTAAKAALQEHVSEYWIDDGQSKIKTIRRSVGSITKSINDLRALKQSYIQILNGRVTILRDSKNFTGTNYRW